MHKDIEKFLDMNHLDPDWRFARKHGQSTKPGIKDEDQDH